MQNRKLIDWAIGVKDVVQTPKHVLIQLATLADKDGTSKASYAHLLELVGCGKATLSLALNELEAKGLIARKGVENPGTTKSLNIYSINPKGN